MMDQNQMNKKFYFLFILSFLSINALYSQIYINPGVDTTDSNIKAAIKFYSNYIGEFKGRKLPDFSKYWSAEDCKKYSVPDPSVYGIGGDYPTYSMTTTKTIHYVKPLKNGIINLKMIGGWVDSLKNFEPMYITNHYLEKKADGNFKLIQPIQFFKNSWQTKKVESITYYYPKYHSFDKKKANNLIRQIRELQQQWGLSPIAIEYFFADTYDEIQLIRGFDFTMGIGNVDKPMGISNQKDHTVFCAGSGEDYFHEVVHIYLNPLHPKSPLNEGLAAYYGGSLGNPIDWHIARLKAYLNQHQEIDLNKLQDFYYMDNYTNPGSAIQGLLCKLAYQKDGITGLKRIMSYTSMNEVFEKEFKMNIKQLNTELRALINQQ